MERVPEFLGLALGHNPCSLGPKFAPTAREPHFCYCCAEEVFQQKH
jgi:hypothetical protein